MHAGERVEGIPSFIRRAGNKVLDYVKLYSLKTQLDDPNLLKVDEKKKDIKVEAEFVMRL